MDDLSEAESEDRRVTRIRCPYNNGNGLQNDEKSSEVEEFYNESEDELSRYECIFEQKRQEYKESRSRSRNEEVNDKVVSTMGYYFNTTGYDFNRINREISVSGSVSNMEYGFGFMNNTDTNGVDPLNNDEYTVDTQDNGSLDVDMYVTYDKAYPFNSNETDRLNSSTFRVSESSLSSLSTPEPIFGKLSKEKGGRVGLRNLGNTCYLNSTLQCLTAVEELSYFLAESYENGTLMKGGDGGRDKLMFLRTIGRLFNEMWQSEGKSTSLSRCVDPNQFKMILGHLDSRFSGYRQEDSQEVLAIILDKLHEGLKITESRNIENENENELELDSELDIDLKSYNDGWGRYCRKENSIIRELFHGQLKSSLKCCKCSFKSETFDPFCFLNLPIPAEREEYKFKETSANYANANVYDMPNVNMSNRSEILSSSTPASSSFHICCYNDRVAYNEDSSYLIIKRTFSSANDFKSSFRGSGHWIVEFEPENGVTSIKSKLPDRNELMNMNVNKICIAYRADLLATNYLVSFTDHTESFYIGFPVLVKIGLYQELTAALFIESFLKKSIRPLLRIRFPSRLEAFDEAINSMEASPNEYFKIDSIPANSLCDLKQVRVTILNDKSDFNNLIFSNETEGDPNELFEELCKDESEPNNDHDLVDDIVEVHRDNSANNDIGYNSDNTCTTFHPPTLKDCFDRLCSVEHLNEWKCEKCQIAVQAEKQLKLWRLPDILICHLKRFSFNNNSSYYSYSYNYGGGSKISTSVDFELEIDLTDVMAEGSPPQSTRYELFAVSQHFGSLHYGHYTAVLKHQATNKWFLADDSSITVYNDPDPGNETESDNNCWFNTKLKEAAYVLFYRRIK